MKTKGGKWFPFRWSVRNEWEKTRMKKNQRNESKNIKNHKKKEIKYSPIAFRIIWIGFPLLNRRRNKNTKPHYQLVIYLLSNTDSSIQWVYFLYTWYGVVVVPSSGRHTSLWWPSWDVHQESVKRVARDLCLELFSPGGLSVCFSETMVIGRDFILSLSYNSSYFLEGLLNIIHLRPLYYLVKKPLNIWVRHS